MKRFTKLLMCAACVAVIGTGTMFARGRGNGGRGDINRKLMLTDNSNVTRPFDLIGQVSSVDEKKGTLTIADMDGKETVVAVSPFTHILISDSKDEKSISDIKKNDWIMYSLFNTETEKKVASRVYVKNN